MKSFRVSRILIALGVASAAAAAHGQTRPYGSPSLLQDYSSQTRANAPAGYRSASAGVNYGPSLAGAQYEPISAAEPLDRLPPEPVAVPDNKSDNPWANDPSLSSPATPDNPWAAPSNNSFGCGCPSCCTSCCSTSYGWFGGLGGIAMTRTNGNAYWTTYETNNNPNQLMNTKQAGDVWAGGGELNLGRWFGGGGPGTGLGGTGGGNGCGSRWGLAVTYWQLGDMNSSASIQSPTNTLSTPMDLGFVNITSGAGTFPASDFFDNAAEHRITRTDRFSNVEINLLNGGLYQSNRCSLSLLAGLRYFRFQEVLTFGSVAGGFQFGSGGGSHEAYLQSRVTNNLFGPQLGMVANWNVTQRFGLFATPKVGIFGDQMNATNRLYTGDGFTTFNIHGHKNSISMIGQIDMGGYYWISPRWQVYGGYRVLGISQVALSDNQFLPFLADSAGYANIKSNGDVILHGAFAGFGFIF